MDPSSAKIPLRSITAIMKCLITAMESEEIPNSFAKSTANEEQAETAITVGIFAIKAFEMISYETRPLTNIQLAFFKVLFKSSSPITLSTALCRPISSLIAKSL